MVPEWFDNNLWPVRDSMSSTVRGIRDAVIITLSTGYRCSITPGLANVSTHTFSHTYNRICAWVEYCARVRPFAEYASVASMHLCYMSLLQARKWQCKQ